MPAPYTPTDEEFYAITGLPAHPLIMRMSRIFDNVTQSTSPYTRQTPEYLDNLIHATARRAGLISELSLCMSAITHSLVYRKHAMANYHAKLHALHNTHNETLTSYTRAATYGVSNDIHKYDLHPTHPIFTSPTFVGF